MKHPLVFAATCVLLLLSCGKKDSTVVVSVQEEKEAGSQNTRKDETDTSSVLGYYVGYFEGVDVDYDKDRGYNDNKITISIDTIEGTTLKGHSVVAGNYTPCEGEVEIKTKVYKTTRWIVTNAMGYKNNTKANQRINTGTLNFIIDEITSTMTGTWQFIDKNSPIYNFTATNDFFKGEIKNSRFYGLIDREGGWKDKKLHPITVYGLEENSDKMTGNFYFNERDLIFEGKMKRVELEVTVKEYSVNEAKEPKDSMYSGVFTFTVDPGTDMLRGSWVPYDTNALAVKSCIYTLRKKQFTYNANYGIEELEYEFVSDETDPHYLNDEYEVIKEGAKLNASTTLLKDEDISNFYLIDLEVLRNAIYARHGYSFRNRRMRNLFDRVSWYVPTSIDVRDELTDTELKNIELIKRYEEHAERYYDSFGR